MSALMGSVFLGMEKNLEASRPSMERPGVRGPVAEIDDDLRLRQILEGEQGQ